MTATIIIYLVACVVAALCGRYLYMLSSAHRRTKVWVASGCPGALSLEEEEEFRCWRQLGKPVTGEGKGLYGAIVADRKQREREIALTNVELRDTKYALSLTSDAHSSVVGELASCSQCLADTQVENNDLSTKLDELWTRIAFQDLEALDRKIPVPKPTGYFPAQHVGLVGEITCKSKSKALVDLEGRARARGKPKPLTCEDYVVGETYTPTEKTRQERPCTFFAGQRLTCASIDNNYVRFNGPYGNGDFGPRNGWCPGRFVKA